MITAIILAVAALWICGLVIFIVSARRAPHGVEDEDGFRVVPKVPGKPPADQPGTPKPHDGVSESKPPGADDGSITPSS